MYVRACVVVERTAQLDLLRACFVWMVRNGQPMPHCKGTEYHEAAPVLRPELKQFEQAVMPTTGGPESGLWCERITQIFSECPPLAVHHASCIMHYASYRPRPVYLPTTRSQEEMSNQRTWQAPHTHRPTHVTRSSHLCRANALPT
jgi:hypothetical protein